MSRDNPEWEIIALQGRLLAVNGVLMKAYSLIDECRKTMADFGIDKDLTEACKYTMSEIHSAICTKTEAYK